MEKISHHNEKVDRVEANVQHILSRFNELPSAAQAAVHEFLNRNGLPEEMRDNIEYAVEEGEGSELLQVILSLSEYEVGSDEFNAELDRIRKIFVL